MAVVRIFLTRVRGRLVFISFLLVLFSGLSAGATEITSNSFKILDPVIEEGGQISTSTSYRLIGSFEEAGLGLSTSTSFTVNSGSLAYSAATAPTLSATTGQLQAALSWTASQGVLGWTISGYDVCQGIAANTYTACTDVGNVLSSTRTGLAANTPYFFRIRAKDAFGNVVVRSNEITVTPTPQELGGTNVGTGPGAGSPITSSPTATDVIFSGRAYTSAAVSLFQNGSVVRQITADASGRFLSTLGGVASGSTYTFGAQARDADGRVSILLTYTVNIPNGVSGTSLEFFLAPTIELSAVQVIQGDSVTARGSAFPGSTVRVEIPSILNQTATAQSNGAWSTTINTDNIAPGTYSVRANAQVGSEITETTAPQTLTIASVAPSPPPACQGSDVNRDGRVNLVDVSALLSFWNQTTSLNQCADISVDGRVDLVDFSILLFNWTG